MKTKRNLQLLLTASAVSALVLSAVGEDKASTDTSKVDRPGYPRVHTSDRLGGASKASELIGTTVNDYQNVKLGKVEDLAVDLESGRVIQVILSTGGVLGVGDTYRAVPPGALHHDLDKGVVHIDADKAKLEGAPKFEMSRWAEQSDATHLSQVYRHYGEESAFNFIDKRDPTVRDASRQSDRVTDKSVAEANKANSFLSDKRSLIPGSRLGEVQRASKIIGTPVRNAQDEKLGKVENLLVDLSSGRLVAVVVSSGGFLGLGDELSAVPPMAFRFNSERDTLQLDTTKELLSAAPHFKANEWPDLTQPSYFDQVYRAYRVEPYFTTNTALADNTKRNVPDRHRNALTPLDQGNSPTDRETTAQIRKHIIADKQMSVNAQNVKIITVDGKVTLRGPVASSEEKRRIGEIAGQIARSENVDNQLEVKLTTTSSN